MNLIEGIDFYYDNGLMVLTRDFLLKRKRCCKGGCRHCPYNSSQSNGINDNHSQDLNSSNKDH